MLIKFLSVTLAILVTIAVFPDGVNAETMKKAFHEPRLSRLTGIIERQEFPGRPNYTSAASGDELEVYWILKLDTPIDIDGDKKSEINVQEHGVAEIQLVLEPAQYKQWKTLLQKHRTVAAAGMLFHAISGHHHTAILMKVRYLHEQAGVALSKEGG